MLVGAENLAANGLALPEVAGVIFRGTALGDWNLSCVRGRLLSATFVFRNGTIRTVRGNEQEPLGELADEFGVPCVSGKRITDAASYLTVSLLIQREMTIDYDPLGRRLHHASALDPHRRDALD